MIVLASNRAEAAEQSLRAAEQLPAGETNRTTKKGTLSGGTPWKDQHLMALNKSALVAKIAGETGLSQAHVNTVVDSLFSVVADSLAKDEKVSIPGWISFESVEAAAREGRNPQTGETLQIPARKRVKAKVGSKLSAAVKN